LVVGGRRDGKYGEPVGDVITGEYKFVEDVKAGVMVDREVVDLSYPVTTMM